MRLSNIQYDEMEVRLIAKKAMCDMRPILWLDKVMDREIDDAIMLIHVANTRKRGNVFPTGRPVPGFGKLMDSILLTTIKKHYGNGAKPALSFISCERRGSFRSLQSGFNPATNRLIEGFLYVLLT